MARLVNFEDEKPTVEGYYYILYVHKSGDKYRKAIWWDGEKFSYRDYVTDVIEYVDVPFDYYVPCEEEGKEMLWKILNGVRC